MRLLAAVRHLAPDSFESFFLRRYDALLTRALHLTGQRRSEAEDLVQSIFVQCSLRKLDVRTLEDPDAYLFVALRNLWLSEVRRSQRLQQPSALDFDSVESALLECRYADRLRLADDLLAVCRFACERKEVSKSGSVLLLRFFLAFSPREVAAIAHLPIGHTHELIRLARREARRAVSLPPAVISQRSSTGSQPSDLAAQFKQLITASTQGECPPAETLDGLYSSRGVPLPTGLLAHVASCPQCLRRVCTRLSVDDDRDPFDPTPPDSRAGVDSKQRDRRLRDAVTQVREHQPLELRVLANGFEVGAMKTRPRVNEMTHTVSCDEPLAIVEVFSDAGVRLLALHVVPPPDGPVAIDDTVALSGGRTLRIAVDFAELKPRVALCYDARETLAEDAPSNGLASRPTAGERLWFGILSPRFVRYLIVVLALLAGVVVADAMDLPSAIADAFRRIVGIARPAAINEVPAAPPVRFTEPAAAAPASPPSRPIESAERSPVSTPVSLTDVEGQVWIRLHELRLDLAGTLRTFHDRGQVVVRGSVATDADRAAVAAIAKDLPLVRAAVRSIESMAAVADTAPPVEATPRVTESKLTKATSAIAGSVLTQAVDIQLNAEAALRIVRLSPGRRDLRDATRRRLEQLLAAYIDGILLHGARLRTSLMTATGHAPPSPVLSCANGERLWRLDWEQLVMTARRLRATTETVFADWHGGPEAGVEPSRASVDERVPLLDRQVAAIQQSLTANCQRR